MPRPLEVRSCRRLAQPANRGWSRLALLVLFASRMVCPIRLASDHAPHPLAVCLRLSSWIRKVQVGSALRADVPLVHAVKSADARRTHLLASPWAACWIGYVQRGEQLRPHDVLPRLRSVPAARSVWIADKSRKPDSHIESVSERLLRSPVLWFRCHSGISMTRH